MTSFQIETQATIQVFCHNQRTSDRKSTAYNFPLIVYKLPDLDFVWLPRPSYSQLTKYDKYIYPQLMTKRVIFVYDAADRIRGEIIL